MSESRPYVKEACIETLEQAIAAENKGADRIELCSNLQLEGLTPSNDLIVQVLDKINIPVRVMIRPRTGNFLYSEKEITEMKRTVITCKNLGVEGVVFGVLKADKTLDIDIISMLTNLAFPLNVVIHKAIDNTPDLLKEFEKLKAIKGISTILTSGGAKTAIEGCGVLKEMIATSQNAIEIMPAGKITFENLSEIHCLLGASAYHGKQIVGKLS
ncbi:copper homeostasis protein [Salegentibacter salinarum]|uniref:PF03932 family protein CutC n=1 Tax=Salegentibacter salinarum TaxID=447422 RepID=A0A2N0TNW2_9FLAO|nr:copper homeostasis protein CutC [Salegentibacter salinarum]PKD16420.1 copper homeostasis protein [Salegentibacter salinarum]SKB64027.1 copper homeostasis protein [Salegentibacter salinarum]